MVFLPASFVAGVFGMNIAEVNPGSRGTLQHYFAVAIPSVLPCPSLQSHTHDLCLELHRLTLLTIWIIMTLQSKKISSDAGEKDTSILVHLLWPYVFARRLWTKERRRFGRLTRDLRI